MKNWQVEVCKIVFDKLGKTTEPKIRAQIGRRLSLLANEIDSVINEAKKPPERIVEYNEKLRKLDNEFLVKVGDVQNANGTTSAASRFREGKTLDEYTKKREAIDTEYKFELIAEEDRVKKVNEFMKEESEIVLAPIKDEWCGDLINGNDWAFLYSIGMILEENADVVPIK